MGNIPNISDGEWEVMRVVWDQHPITAVEVAELVEPRTGWTERTVKTLLSRLVQKGALRFKSEGKRYQYRPAVSRSAMIRAESRSFLDRVFDGQASPFLAQIVRQSKLSPDEIAQLKKLLDEKGGR